LDDIRRLRTRPPGEYSWEDSSSLIKEFGASAEESESIRRHLTNGRSVLVFSESNSVMLVYMDEDSRALRAECFLQ
jgi:hypothetical protein